MQKNSQQMIEATRERLREAMPVAERWAYFDHAAVAPLSSPAAEAIVAWCEEATHDGDTRWLRWEAAAESARRDAARCVEGCNSCETICHFQVSPRLDQTLDCSLCGECLVVCPTSCITIGPSGATVNAGGQP